MLSIQRNLTNILTGFFLPQIDDPNAIDRSNGSHSWRTLDADFQSIAILEILIHAGMNDVGDEWLLAFGHAPGFRHFFCKITSELISRAIKVNVAVHVLGSNKYIHDESYWSC